MIKIHKVNEDIKVPLNCDISLTRKTPELNPFLAQGALAVIDNLLAS